MSNVIGEIASGIAEEMIQSSDVTTQLFDSCLYTQNIPQVDLLIRTSGEVRFSDFMLWQVGFGLLGSSGNNYMQFIFHCRARTAVFTSRMFCGPNLTFGHYCAQFYAFKPITQPCR